MKPTLLILAAGMGSRYGGLKQIDRFGPNGETIMDYAVYDALAAGFAKVVFIIRRDFEAEFRAAVGSKYENRVAIDYVFQGRDTLPAGFSARADRTKPWGTAHAIWCARDAVKEPFLVVNADDFYGNNSYKLAAEFLARSGAALTSPDYCVVGYPVLETLSDHGSVARGICEVDGAGYLTGLVERTRIEKWGATGKYLDETGTERFLKGDEVVSMNMLGFTPALFGQLERYLIKFLERQSVSPDNSECILSVVLGELLKENSARVCVLPTRDVWFGVTHAEDKPGVVDTLRKMVERGQYPSPIW